MEQKEHSCQFKLMVSRDALEVIYGKWRIPIIISLLHSNKRFSEIQKEIGSISPKMLSQELKVLEEYKIITRTLYDSMPVRVEYALTPLGLSLQKPMNELLEWGLYFREQVLVKETVLV